jgi:hypothetical protein
MGSPSRLESLASAETLAQRFVLERALQTGPLVCVWCAQDLETGHTVVLKLAHADAAATAALAREVACATSIAHPRVVKPSGPIVADGLALLVSPYLVGGDLSRWRGQSWRVFTPALLSLLEVLAAVHAAGLVHRDLKPGNVLLDDAGAAHLADFGIAARVGEALGGGSPHSQSPTQAARAPAAIADDLYGIGALLHELLSGYPPRYGATPSEALRPLHPTPAAVVTLAGQLLSTDPAVRPSLAAIRAVFEHAVRAPADVIEAGPRAAVEVVPPPRATTADWQPMTASAPAPRSTAPERRPPWIAVTATALVLGLVGVLFVLPRWVATQPAPTYRQAASDVPAAPTPAPAAAPAGNPLPTSPEALQALAEQKTAAEDARSRYDDALAPLRSLPVTAWAEAQWQGAETAGKTATEKYTRRDYTGAAQDWDHGVALAKDIKAARAPALQQALQTGRTALAQQQSQAAVAAFTRALAIEPGQKEATAGLRRAQSLDQVLALVDAGATAERAAQWSEASDKYRAALAIDALAPGAQAGLTRIAQVQHNDAFAAAMAAGLRAAAANDRNGARAAFARAEKLSPGSPAVRDALAALDGADRTQRLARLQADAQAAERGERWVEALKAYEAALELDGTVVFAQEGRARVQPRADVATRLDAMLAKPERLTYATVREEARALLAQAQRWSEGPAFRTQRERIEALLRAAETPVKLALESDNVTDVVVYRIGRLGMFDRQEVELLPGRYTIVGKRAGFRDVRREVEIPPGGSPPPVTVRCEERI